MNKIDRLFYEQTKTSGILKKNDSLLVCVSGGPDSLALLYLLLSIQSPFSLSLGIAHVNHGWRKMKSDLEAQYIQQVSKDLSLPFFLHSVDPTEWDSIPGTGYEEKGRYVRTHFFWETAKKEGFRLIALGHTEDDLLETLLFNLIRGTSPEGFANLMPLYDPTSLFYRPLLFFTKSVLIEYLSSKNIPFHQDESNFNDAFTRNKIRNQVMPLLRSINPSVGQAILRFRETLQEEASFLFEMVSNFLTSKAIILKDEVQILKKDYSLLPKSLQLHLIREIRKIITRTTNDFYFSQIISIHKGIMNKEDFSYYGKNLRIECKNGLIMFFAQKREDERE